MSYAFKPFVGSSHTWALGEIDRMQGPLRVLDVGAGPGHLARAIRERRDPLELVAVEPTAQAGGPLDEVADRWVTDLAAVDEDGFDLALLLDVLEHVPQPGQLLEEVRRRLRPGGTVLISVPNVAHWSLRASLLLGRFDYAERGILDRTHLRFFTRRTLLSTIADAGLSLQASDCAVVPLELGLPRGIADAPAWRAITAGRLALARACPGLLAFQLLARATA